MFDLLFINVTEERHVVPFDFLYKAELDDSRTTTRLTTVLFQRSCPLPGSFSTFSTHWKSVGLKGPERSTSIVWRYLTAAKSSTRTRQRV